MGDAPSVSYRETVTMESSIMCLSKSPNKHNRLFVKAEPMSEELCQAIEKKVVYPTQDQKKRVKHTVRICWLTKRKVSSTSMRSGKRSIQVCFGQRRRAQFAKKTCEAFVSTFMTSNCTPTPFTVVWVRSSPPPAVSSIVPR